MDSKHPTGACMVARTLKVKDQARAILEQWPQARGNDSIGIFRWLRRYYPELRISFTQFEVLLRTPTFETYRRRAQELRHDCQARHDSGETEQYGEGCICASERVKKKRFIRAVAFKHHFGNGQLTINDCEDWKE